MKEWWRKEKNGGKRERMVRQLNNFQWWSANRDKIYKVVLESKKADNRCPKEIFSNSLMTCYCAQGNNT